MPESDVMHSIFGTAVGVATASAGTGSAKTYDIGPGQTYANIADLDWTKVGPGDTVNIHYKPGGYHELFQISTRGTPLAWITINGIPDPATGALPTIDGYQAVLAPQFQNHYTPLHGYGGLVVGLRPGYTEGYKPGYILVQGLQFQNVYRGDSGGNTFTDYDGSTKTYGTVGAGIYLERADHVTIKKCVVANNGEGIFGAGQSGFNRLMTDITLDSNYIYGNGNIGTDQQHNTYLEGVDTLYQFNQYGPLRAGAGGAGLKDRSVGTIIRDNYIEGGAHQLQLPESQNQSSLAMTISRYHQMSVYGNVLVAPPGAASTVVYYGGDLGLTPYYRKGVLYLYSNTIVVRSDRSVVYGNTAAQLASAGEAIDARNNIIVTIPNTVGANPPYLGLVSANANAYIGANWVTPGYNVANWVFNGNIAGLGNILAATSSDPGFVDLRGGDYRLAAGSICIDAAGRLPGSVAAFPVDQQYLDPHGRQSRSIAGIAADLGAFEYVAAGAHSAPVAADNSYNTSEDTALTVAAAGVLGNDTDAEGDSLTASLVTGPAHGTLTLNTNGSFTYTPAANYHGSDSFTYRAYDGSAYSGVATVSLTVNAVNDAPVAAADSYSTPMGTALTVAASGVLANDTDAEGSALTASLVTGPAHGVLSLNANGSFVYTPAAGYSGSDSFVYRASDGSAYSANATVSLTVAPVSVPSAPTSLAATAVSSSQINLTWADQSSNETGFKIERKSGSNGAWAQIATVGANVRSYSDTGRAASTTYFYRVRAYNNGGNSSYSNEASANTQPPIAPTALSAAATSTSQITLRWTDQSTNETGFKIERKLGISGAWAQIATVGANVTTYIDANRTVGQTYYYRVRAYNNAGNSTLSNETSARISLPAVPATLRVIAASSSQISLIWADQSSNETGFKIERKTGVNGAWAQITTVGPNVMTYTDTNRAASTTYYYRVRAYNGVGNSPYSNQAYTTTSAAAVVAPAVPGPSSQTSTYQSLLSALRRWAEFTN
jgi:VCBS repeat-containing protein